MWRSGERKVIGLEEHIKKENNNKVAEIIGSDRKQRKGNDLTHSRNGANRNC